MIESGTTNIKMGVRQTKPSFTTGSQSDACMGETERNEADMNMDHEQEWKKRVMPG